MKSINQSIKLILMFMYKCSLFCQFCFLLFFLFDILKNVCVIMIDRLVDKLAPAVFCPGSAV